MGGDKFVAPPEELSGDFVMPPSVVDDFKSRWADLLARRQQLETEGLSSDEIETTLMTEFPDLVSAEAAAEQEAKGLAETAGRTALDSAEAGVQLLFSPSESADGIFEPSSVAASTGRKSSASKPRRSSGGRVKSLKGIGDAAAKAERMGSGIYQEDDQ